MVGRGPHGSQSVGRVVWSHHSGRLLQHQPSMIIIMIMVAWEGLVCGRGRELLWAEFGEINKIAISKWWRCQARNWTFEPLSRSQLETQVHVSSRHVWGAEISNRVLLVQIHLWEVLHLTNSSKGVEEALLVFERLEDDLWRCPRPRNLVTDDRKEI